MTTEKETTVENYFAAIDLGSSKITGVVAQKTDEGRINIVACEQTESQGIRRGEVKNLADTAFKINEVVRKLENHKALRDNKIFIKKVYVGLDGHSLKTQAHGVKRILGGEEVTEETINEMLGECWKMRLENSETFDVIEQEFVVDGMLEYNPVGMTCNGVQGNYKIIHGKPELKRSLLRSFEKANQLEVAGMFISPIATAQAALTETDKEMGCALIDFGADTTSICVYYNGYLRHVATVPFGGNVVTSDIKDLHVTQDIAERIKKKFGNAMASLETKKNIVIPEQEEKMISTEVLASLIEARMDEILDFVWQEIEKSKFASKLGNGIIITGGASKLTNLDKLISSKTGCDVRYANFARHIDIESKFDETINPLVVGLLLLANETCAVTKEVIEIEDVAEENEEIKNKKSIKKGFGTRTKRPIVAVTNFFGNLFNLEENDENEKM